MSNYIKSVKRAQSAGYRNIEQKPQSKENFAQIIPLIFKIFNYYSLNSEYLSYNQYKTFLSDISICDSKTLTIDYLSLLFRSFSNKEEMITFNQFVEIIMKISNLKYPENFKKDPKNAISLFFHTFLNPILILLVDKNNYDKKDNEFYVESINLNNEEYSFNNLSNHKLIISKISSLLTKEIIEKNYLLFLKIYQKYFCFENLKISKSQKNHLSQRAFIKVMTDFNISPNYLSNKQIEDIYNRLIDNMDYTKNILEKLINVNLCNNDGMWFTLYLFIAGIYLISVFNTLITNYNENRDKKIWEIFVNNNDSQAFENIIKVFYKSSNLNNVMPEDIQKVQLEILNNKKQSEEFKNSEKIDKINKNNETAKFSSNKNNLNIKNNKRAKSKSKTTITKSKTLSNKLKNNIHYKFINSMDNTMNGKQKSSFMNLELDISSKISGNPNESKKIVDIAPLIVKRYSKQLITVYKYYSEMYYETIFSIYMTQNGFINFIKDLNLLDPDNLQENINNLPLTQKFMLQNQVLNLLNYSAINFIFSKFSSNPSIIGKKQIGNKRINFVNFIYLILCLANKIYNPKFSNISFSDKLFSYDDLTNGEYPIKFAFTFVEFYIKPLYQNILPFMESDNLDMNNINNLIENETTGPFIEKVISLFIRLLKCYTDNKDYVDYSQYFKFLSDFGIFPEMVQRTKMIKIFINFIENFDELFLLHGNNKVVLDIEACAQAILYIGVGSSDMNDICNLEYSLLNFFQKIAQSNKLGKICVDNFQNSLQKDFLNLFYALKKQIIGEKKRCKSVSSFHNF